jgi:hypothetical protein
MVHDKKLEVLLEHLVRCRRFFDIVRWSSDVISCAEDDCNEDEFDRAIMSLELARDAIEVELGEAKLLVLRLIDLENPTEKSSASIFRQEIAAALSIQNDPITLSPALSCSRSDRE